MTTPDTPKVSNQRHAAGPDAPVWAQDQDALERWWFAKEAFELATTSPADWSVRIGIYGEWGTGKSSVLGFVRTMCEREGHVVVHFNPWGCSSQYEMWHSFVLACFEAFETKGLKPPGTAMTQAKQLASRGVGLLDKLKDVHENLAVLSTVMNAASSSSMLRLGINDIAALAEMVQPKKVLVLIDDVDRVDPPLLPALLQSLKEVLAVQGFSFILALDPAVVSAALAHHHPGWGNGFRFLEKIIDFPLWLPEPSGTALWALARRDVETYCNFVDLQALNRVFELCPKNPRSLRQYIRHLWSLKREVARHDKDELDWTLLLLVQLLRCAAPTAAQTLLADEDLVARVAVMKYIGRPRVRDGRKDTISQVRDMLTELGVPEAELPRVDAIVHALCEHGFSAGSMEYVAFLNEHPHAVTWKEYRTLIKGDSSPSAAATSLWIRTHASARGVIPSQVVAELFEAACRSWHTELALAADLAKTDAELRQHVARAGVHLRLIHTLSLELPERPFSPGGPFGRAEFARVVGTTTSWLHFSNHEDYRAIREQERQLIFDIVERSGLAPDVVYLAVRPAQDFPGGEAASRPEAFALRGEILRRVEPQVCALVIDDMAKPGAGEALFTKERMVLGNLLLSSKTSIYRDPTIRARLDALATSAESNTAAQINCISVLHKVYDHIKESHETLLHPGTVEVAREHGLAVVLWRGATAQQLQPRIQGSLEHVRRCLEEKLDINLPLPSWWAPPAPSKDEDDEESVPQEDEGEE